MLFRSINGKNYEGEVIAIDGMAKTNASNATVVTAYIRIKQPDESIYLGLDAKIKITCKEEKDTILVPINCVNYDKEGTFCFVVVDGKLERREVMTGISSDTDMQILEGLSVDDMVVSEMVTGLEEGVDVNPLVEE